MALSPPLKHLEQAGLGNLSARAQSNRWRIRGGQLSVIRAFGSHERRLGMSSKSSVRRVPGRLYESRVSPLRRGFGPVNRQMLNGARPPIRRLSCLYFAMRGGERT